MTTKGYTEAEPDAIELIVSVPVVLRMKTRDDGCRMLTDMTVDLSSVGYIPDRAQWDEDNGFMWEWNRPTT